MEFEWTSSAVHNFERLETETQLSPTKRTYYALLYNYVK